jgi:glycosyltransferase involved in cell wall biosynthesis
VKISVIIPARNEEQSILLLLDSLAGQTMKPSEIVITDAGSTDRTAEIIESYKTAAPIRLVRAEAALPGRARNLAAAQATSEWLAFIDAGVQPEPDWLEQLARQTAPGNELDVDAAIVDVAEVVYGTYEPVVNTLFKQCVAIATIAPPVEFGGKLVRPRSIVSALMKRSVWEQVGGFPENLRSAEDLLFMNRIKAAGFRVAQAPDALVHWQLQATPWPTFKRFVTYARNNMRAGLWREWQAAIFKRYALLLAAALPVFWLGARWLLVTLLLWLLLLAARGVVAIWRNRACYPGGLVKNAVRLLVLIPLLGMIDAATITGTLAWAVGDAL